MSKNGIAPRRYSFRGGSITAKEAADQLHISIKTMYNRLQKCGDNMELVFDYYEGRYGRGGVMPI